MKIEDLTIMNHVYNISSSFSPVICNLGIFFPLADCGQNTLETLSLF